MTCERKHSSRNFLLARGKSKRHLPTYQFGDDDDNPDHDHDHYEDDHDHYEDDHMTNLTESAAEVARHLCVKNRIQTRVGVSQNMGHDL